MVSAPGQIKDNRIDVLANAFTVADAVATALAAIVVVEIAFALEWDAATATAVALARGASAGVIRFIYDLYPVRVACGYAVGNTSVESLVPQIGVAITVAATEGKQVL